MRLALGASAGPLVRQLLTEGLLLTVLGVSGALILSFWLINTIPASLGSQKKGFVLALAGLAIGLVTAPAVTRLLASQLFGVRAVDLVTFGAAAILVIAVALATCYLPSRRATIVDPMVALRYE
jgi:ABC-type antimicrobial peptide transport system permease subunit